MEDLFDLFDLFEVQPEGSLWRGAVNGRKTASSKLAAIRQEWQAGVCDEPSDPRNFGIRLSRKTSIIRQ